MKKRSLILILAALVLVSATACRSRRKPVEPVPVPVESTPQPAPTVEVPEPKDDFPPAPAQPGDVLSEDIVEADRVARERGWIRDAFFTFDASTLDDAAQEALGQTATWLRAHPEFTIRVEGHCDERGTEQYNLALGDRRAEAAVAYLVSLGVARERIRTVSYGEERPFAEGSSEEAWSQNRRAHVALTGRQ